MLLSQVKAFKELKVRYGYDIAISRDLLPKEEEDLFQTLLLHDADKKIVEAINSVSALLDDDPAQMSAFVILLMQLAGNVAGRIAEEDPLFATQIYEIGKTRFEEKLKGEE